MRWFWEYLDGFNGLDLFTIVAVLFLLLAVCERYSKTSRERRYKRRAAWMIRGKRDE